MLKHILRGAPALLCATLLATAAWAREAPSSAHQLFRVTLDKATAQRPAAGRLLLFATEAKAARAAAKDGKVEAVDVNPFAPTSTAIAARDVARLAPGGEVLLDADDTAFPAAFSKLPPGDYLVQAVLDVNHDYNYRGRSGGDLLSKVVEVRLPAAAAPELALVDAVPARQPWNIPARYMSEATKKHLDEARRATQPLDFVSPALSAFWGRPIHLRGWVVLPPGYDPKSHATYPVVYFTHGYGADAVTLSGSAAMVYGAMAERQMPPMIWVMLDQSSPTGTHEFADSVNNGPWGQALTAELIPALEARYRMDARAAGRFLTGHSSGGWATLWLQTRYPKVFGGTWSTSPDPSDFHDFTGVDLYAPHANVYRGADGAPHPLVRDHGKVMASYADFARMERVLGPYGGQMASFEWVFSPRGPDGRPLPMFDRDTGAVDPAVVAYWGEHYDIARRLKEHWPELKPDLDGKIHLYVGTADTFYLDGAAHRLKAVLDGLGAKSDIRFLPDRTHFDLFVQGEDRQALLKRIAWDMYAQARPGAALGPAAAP
ncbi:alpha/beta hydrolase [Fulvimonas soli]|jgi:S-formylglutathione hydrolase FrmB|uniref:Putative esterase n=1 Tax=Fulvimonas soli TaxID=155197 RepID=A0A316HZB2_9GAMM|nr:alpha/beta hydrolase-fold protein [Fulvimonas soli]PWK85329.1 putative esterase [Fulvimonas soli]TNY27367.1 enterochelin esterase [Fulvimonas soli]